MIFSWLEGKVPRLTFVKKRMNDDVLIICAENLSIYYLNSTASTELISFFMRIPPAKKKSSLA